MIKKTTRKKGAVLLIAVLVASVALAVGFGVYQRTYKELLFGSYWRQTQIAFSSADSGLECAMYWLLHPGGGGAGTANCFGSVISGWDPKVQTGNFNLTVPGAGCANVVIAWDPTVLPAGATTTVVKGYNDCIITNPRSVERGLGAALSP